MTDDDNRSPAEVAAKLMPGSATFQVRALCPNCGWHFPSGMTDPKGDLKGLVPDCVVVCGECLSVVRFDAQLKPEALSSEAIRALPEDVRSEIAALWKLSYLARMLAPPITPRVGPVQ